MCQGGWVIARKGSEFKCMSSDTMITAVHICDVVTTTSAMPPIHPQSSRSDRVQSLSHGAPTGTSARVWRAKSDCSPTAPSCFATTPWRTCTTRWSRSVSYSHSTAAPVPTAVLRRWQDDFRHDKAWGHYAGVMEMCALSLFMSDQNSTPTSRCGRLSVSTCV